MKKIYSLLTVVLVFVPFAVQAAFGDTTTYLSKPFEVHKARLAKDALFDFPTDIDVTDDGIFVIADTYNHAIRKITKKGKVKTIAGNGSYGDKSGARFKAEFAYPQGVDIDNGVVYVADTGNHRISKIKDGQVTTLVQNLNAPEGVRVFGDILYFLDTGNGLLKKVSINGGKVTTVASGLSGPKKLTITVDGAYAYVANVGTYQVKKVNLASGQVTTLAGSGSAGEKNGACATATFRNLYGVHLDGNYLYVSDGNGSSDFVRRIDLTACQVETFASDESMVSINYPNGLTTYNGGLYVVATGISIVEKYNLDDAAVNSKFAGKDRFNVRDAKPVLIGNPKYLQLSKDKKWIIFSENNRIRKVKRTNLKDSELIAGSVVDNYNTNKDGDNTPRVGADARFSDVTSFAVSKDGKKLYVVDRNNNRIKEVDLKTRTMTYLTGAGGINAASNSNGSADGIACSNEYETGKKNCAYFNRPQGSVLAKDGKILYVTDTGNHSIRAVIVKGDNKGKVTTLAGGTGAGFVNGVGTAAKFQDPIGLARSYSGKVLYVADRGNHVIRKINIKTGQVTTYAGNGNVGNTDAILTAATFSYPEWITRDSSGNLYVSDVGSQQIRMIDHNAQVTKLVAGSGDRGYQNGQRFTTRLNNPKGLLVLNKKKLLVAELFNDTLRAIDITAPAPYTELAPYISSSTPQSVEKNWFTNGAFAGIQVKGKNFRNGATVWIGPYQAVHTYVESEISLVAELPYTKMQPGFYTVRVENSDGQYYDKIRALRFAINGNSAGDYWPPQK